MNDKIILFRRKTQRLRPEHLKKLGARLGLKGEVKETEEALFLHDGERALAYAQPYARFAGLLFHTDQSIAWGGVGERLIAGEKAAQAAHDLLAAADLLPGKMDDKRVNFAFELKGVQTEAIVFDGTARKAVKAKTDIVSDISLNGVPVTGPRGKVRMIFKNTERPVMVHAGLWGGLTVHEERPLVAEHDVVRTVREKLAERKAQGQRGHQIRDIRLVYFAGEYQGGADLLTPEYLVELELHDDHGPSKTGERLQGPRHVMRIPAFR